MKQRTACSLLLLAVAGVSALPGCANERANRSYASDTSAFEIRGHETDAEPAARTVSGWPSRRSGSDMAWTALAYPTGSAKTSAIGLEKGMPTEVRSGTPFDYQLIVTNLTDQRLQDVVVTDKADGGFRMSESMPKGSAGADGMMRWNLGTLAPKEQKVITIKGQATGGDEIGYCSEVSYNSMLCASVPVVSPKLRLVKTGPAMVSKCDEIVYRFVVSNPGTGSVRNVRINDPLPAGLTTVDGRRTIEFNVGTLGAGQSKTFNARVEATRRGSFANRATAVGEGVQSVNSETVTTVVREPVLTVKLECPERSYAGRPVTRRVTVKNTGDGACANTVVTAPLSPRVRFDSASDGGRAVDGKISWKISELAPNATKTFTYSVTPQAIGTIQASVRATCDCATAVTDSCAVRVEGIPAILLEVVDVEDPVQVGNNETYLITVTNQGSAPDTNIRIVATLESNMTFVSASGATRGTGRGQTITFEPLATLGPKEKAVFRVVVKTTKAGDTRFSVAMNSDQLTRPVDETEATNIYE